MFLITNLRHIKRYLRLPGLLAVNLLIVTSCSEEISSDVPTEEEGIITVGAEIAAEIFTRENDDNIVKEGSYYLSYPIAADNSYSLATVVFGTDSSNPQIGFVSLRGDEPFKWLQVGGSTPVFYLDNVKPDFSIDSEDPTIVEFNDINPFKAGIYDPENPENDLLWGTKTVQRNTMGTINFDLHHNMSRVQVQVTRDNTYETEGSLELKGAKVWISNVILSPKTFNRLTGLITLDSNNEKAYGDLVLVNESGEEDKIEWSEIWNRDTSQDNDVTDETDNDGENSDKDTEKVFPVYLSQSCIVPPQEILDNEKRPRLYIELKNGSIFSGILPHAMEIDPPGTSESQNPYPVTLSFLKEHVLTIRTVISEEPPELSFMPVKVVEWVDKGEFDLEAHQAGIYTPAEFFKMIEYYQAGNLYQLQRYGWLNENDASESSGNEEKTWNFNFFSTIILQVDKIDELFGKMKPEFSAEKYDYEFIFNNYTIYIRIGTADPVSVSPEQLRNILSGSNKTPFE